jgi:hypothetical protein
VLRTANDPSADSTKTVLFAALKLALVLRTANGSSVESAEIIAFAALKPPTDFCRRALAWSV